MNKFAVESVPEQLELQIRIREGLESYWEQYLDFSLVFQSEFVNHQTVLHLLSRVNLFVKDSVQLQIHELVSSARNLANQRQAYLVDTDLHFQLWFILNQLVSILVDQTQLFCASLEIQPDGVISDSFAISVNV